MSAMLEINGLSTRYGGIEALRDVSLRLAEGEMVALVGANGAGKSSLLNSLSGLVPSSGSIRFDGREIRGRSAHAIARMGVIQVPEGRQVIAGLSVLENLQLGQLALGGRKPRFRLSDIYRIFPILAERRAQGAGSLSGGQQQMLAIGRALMGSPRLLLLDEPSLGLAPIIVSQVFDAIRQLSAEGLTILLVEQNARRALDSTRRAYVIDQGKIVVEAASRELLADSRIVDAYLGTPTSQTQEEGPPE